VRERRGKEGGKRGKGGSSSPPLRSGTLYLNEGETSSDSARHRSRASSHHTKEKRGRLGPLPRRLDRQQPRLGRGKVEEQKKKKKTSRLRRGKKGINRDAGFRNLPICGWGEKIRKRRRGLWGLIIRTLGGELAQPRGKKKA